MYDLMVRSTIFGVRNLDKTVNTNDKGRILASVGQMTKAAKTAAQLDNVLGRGADAAIKAAKTAADGHKILHKAAKCANWAADHVNPLLIGAAGYRVLSSDDKTTSLKREIIGMSAMFSGEALIKQAFNCNYMKSVKAGMKNPKAKIALSISEGVLFVVGSITCSTLGYKIAKKFFPDKNKTEKTIPQNTNNDIPSKTTPKVLIA